MFKHDCIKTTSVILSKTYVCLKCCKFSSRPLTDNNCKYHSRTDSQKYNHKWDERNYCVKCGRFKNNVVHNFVKVGEWENPISRIEPCELTNDEFTIKEILE